MQIQSVNCDKSVQNKTEKKEAREGGGKRGNENENTFERGKAIIRSDWIAIVECVLCVMWVNFAKLCTSVYILHVKCGVN